MTDPASNPRAALLLLGIAVVALLIIALVVSVPVVLLSGRRRGKRSGDTALSAADAEADEDGEEAEPAPHKGAGGCAVWLTVLLIIFCVPIALGLRYTSQDAFCAQCHYTKPARESHAEGSHSSVSCSRCHEAGGVSSYVDAKSRGVRNAWATAMGDARKSGPVRGVVADGACLQCHDAVLSSVSVSRGIRVRHSDVIAAGYHCLECHNTEGHGDAVTRARHPEMRYCIACHDGAAAPSECVTCHPEGTERDGAAKNTRRPRRWIPRVNIVKEDCRGCHSMKPCIDCHGIELPHSRRFVEGYHASYAFDNMDMCLRCHDLYAFCSNRSCHMYKDGMVSEDGLRRVKWQHGADFRQAHKEMTAQRCEGCHRNEDMCQYCHGDVPDH